MDKMELAPFPGCQWAENRMVSQGLSRAEGAVAVCNDGIHSRDVLENFRFQLREGSAAGQNAFGRLAPGGHVAEPDHDAAPPAFAVSVGTGASLAGRQAAFKIFDGAAIGEVEMIQDLRRAPFTLNLPCEVLCRHSFDCVGESKVQFGKFRVHL